MSIPLTIVLAIVLTVFWLDSDHRAATESPDYKVNRTEVNFDLRQYPTQTVATTGTPIHGDGTNAIFEQLFRDITDRNNTSGEIEMTSPALIDTARDNKAMRFIMPRKAVEKGLSQLVADNVALGKVEQVRFAALRFGGSRATQIEHGSTGLRHAWLARQTLTGWATLRMPVRSTLDAFVPASQHTDDSNCRTA